jgi:RNA polymerase sigma-70 factor, ECF subfamily
MKNHCLMQAWRQHERELRGYLRHRLGDPIAAEDLLQDIFIKALTQGQRFCALDNARAWLFTVTRNALADLLRLAHDTVELPDDLHHETEEPVAVDNLAQCLPRALAEISAADRDAIAHCDLHGMPQEDYAKLKGLTLAAAKSRVQRARKRLRRHLTTACQVSFDDSGKVGGFVPRPTLKPDTDNKR